MRNLFIPKKKKLNRYINKQVLLLFHVEEPVENMYGNALALYPLSFEQQIICLAKGKYL